MVNWRMISIVLTAAILLPVQAALAIIKVPNSLYALWNGSAQVVEGKVTGVGAGGKEVQLAVTEATVRRSQVPPLSGTIRIQIPSPADLAVAPATGQHAVIFVGRKGGSLVHVGDTWLQAEGSNAGTFAVTATYKEGTAAYPGRTQTLVRIIAIIKKNPNPPPGRDAFSAAELAAAGNPLRDTFEHSSFGNNYPLGNLGIKATFMTAADVNGDKKADLLVLAAEGAKFFLGTGPKTAFKEADWGLAGIKAPKAAFGDVNGDGRPEVLLNTLWANTGSKFGPSKTGVDLSGKDVLAVAIADVSGDGKPDAMALLKNGQLLVFENSGSTDAAWKARAPVALWQGGGAAIDAHFGDFGENGKTHVMVIREDDITRYPLDGDGPPAGMTRLTGMSPALLATQNWSKNYFPIKRYVTSVVIDLGGGDGRPDLLVETLGYKCEDIFMLNRGYGAFWLNNEGGMGGRGAARQPVALAAADMYGDGSHELLLIDDKGDLVQLNSPPYKKGSPAGE